MDLGGEVVDARVRSVLTSCSLWRLEVVFLVGLLERCLMVLTAGAMPSLRRVLPDCRNDARASFRQIRAAAPREGVGCNTGNVDAKLTDLRSGFDVARHDNLHWCRSTQ